MDLVNPSGLVNGFMWLINNPMVMVNFVEYFILSDAVCIQHFVWKSLKYFHHPYIWGYVFLISQINQSNVQ